MKKLALLVCLALAFALSPAKADPPVFNGVISCQGAQYITFSGITAQTTEIALSGTTRIYICSYMLNITGSTSAVASLVYGTGANCGTGTGGLSGVFGPPQSATAAATFGLASWLPIMQTLAGQAVCVQPGGTTPSVSGFIQYVQQ